MYDNFLFRLSLSPLETQINIKCTTDTAQVLHQWPIKNDWLGPLDNAMVTVGLSSDPILTPKSFALTYCFSSLKLSNNEDTQKDTNFIAAS